MDKPIRHTPGSLKRLARNLQRRVAKKERDLLKMRTAALKWKSLSSKWTDLVCAIEGFDPNNPTRDDYLIDRLPKE
jgi:hypothetical protein